jgi:hypothetical protein
MSLRDENKLPTAALSSGHHVNADVEAADAVVMLFLQKTRKKFVQVYMFLLGLLLGLLLCLILPLGLYLLGLLCLLLGLDLLMLYPSNI